MKCHSTTPLLALSSQLFQMSYGTSIVTRSRATCSNFAIAQYEGSSVYTRPGNNTFIVSRGVNCQNSTQACPLDFGGYVTDGQVLNITTDSASTSSIFSTVSTAANITFVETITAKIDDGGFHVQNGTSGYATFTPNYRCSRGMLSDCDNEDLNNVYVEACSPYKRSGEWPNANGIPHIHGDLTEVTTNDEIAAALTCNPANTTAARNGISSNNCSIADNSTSDDSDPVEGSASMVSMMDGTVLIGSMVLGFFCAGML